MDGFPQVVESAQLPLVLPIRPYVKDHCFNGQAVLPAVEAMEALAQAVRRFRPAADVALMSGVTFDKFLYLDPGAGPVSAFGEISVHANGDVRAVLTTRARSKHAVMARVKTHVALTLPRQAPPSPELPLDLASAPEGVGFAVGNEKIYPELVAFGPSYQNVVGLHLMPRGAVAEIRIPTVGDAIPMESSPLGSPFALDAAFHVACAWGQRYAGIVAFPVAVDRRRIYAPTRPAEAYFVHVLPVQTDPALLVFDLRIYDREGSLREACFGVRMRDVSGGRMVPPEWIRTGAQATAVDRIAGASKAAAVIELAALAPFAERALSEPERLRLAGMGSRRKKSYLAARVACKRVARQLSDNDARTAAGDITTVCPDRPERPRCPASNGRCVFSCSVSHDDRFAVAVAADRRVGVDVEQASERLLKSRSLYMSEPEQALARESRLGEIEAAVRIWSIKEAVAKSLDVALATAWRRVQVRAVGSLESGFSIDGEGSYAAVHGSVERHVFTLV
jgi:phosphopantetheinyl transferase